MELDLVVNNSDNDTANCQLSEHQVKIIAEVRGASSVVCTILCVLSLGITCRYMNRRFFEHRLLVYLTLASLLNLFAIIGQGVTFDDDVHHDICTVIATFDQFSRWLTVLVAVWIIVYFLVSYGEQPYNYSDPHEALRRCKREILPVCVFVIWSAMFAIVPTITDTYGVTRGWCWIRVSDNKCNKDIIGFAEQWVLWLGWQILIVVSAPVVLVIGVWRSHRIARAMKQTANQTAESYRKKAKASGIVLFTFLTLYTLFNVYQVCEIIYSYISDRFSLVLRIVDAAYVPISIVILPLLVMLYLYCAGKFPAITPGGGMRQHVNTEREHLV